MWEPGFEPTLLQLTEREASDSAIAPLLEKMKSKFWLTFQILSFRYALSKQFAEQNTYFGGDFTVGICNGIGENEQDQ